MKLNRVQSWQSENPGRHIFWMTETKKKFDRLRWVRKSGKHGTLINLESNEIVWSDPVALEKSLVTYYYKRAQKIVWDLTIPLNLNFQDSVIFSAINLAFLLGAKEINLLGVDLEDNSHFYNENAMPFPKAEQIVTKFAEQAKQYAVHGCQLVTCRKDGPASKALRYNDFPQAVTPVTNFSMDCLAKKISRLGKCFLLGAGDSLNAVQLQQLCGWPVIGVNTAWLKYPWLDALMFGDLGFVTQYETHIREWQRSREEKPLLFWHATAERDGFCRVVPWEHAPKGSQVVYENPPGISRPVLSIKHSIITPAINLAYFLGAKEVYLLGVDLDTNNHFWDSDESTAKQIDQPTGSFPGGQRIADYIESQAQYFAENGRMLAKCTAGGLLEGVIPTAKLEDVADARKLNLRFENGKG